MAVQLALYQPDIPQNTGTLLRLGACLGFTTHIIHPTGFNFSEKSFRRAAMDYAGHARFIEHRSFAAFMDWVMHDKRRLILLTTKADQSAYRAGFGPDDVLMAGRESAGVPDEVARQCDLRLRIPMQAEMRSLNVAAAAAMLMGEALRQTNGFEGLQ